MYQNIITFTKQQKLLRFGWAAFFKLGRCLWNILWFATGKKPILPVAISPISPMLMTMEIYNLDMKLNVCEKYTSMKVSTYFTNCLSLPVVHRTKADVSL